MTVIPEELKSKNLVMSPETFCNELSSALTAMTKIVISMKIPIPEGQIPVISKEYAIRHLISMCNRNAPLQDKQDDRPETVKT
jgi:hypothetical protein